MRLYYYQAKGGNFGDDLNAWIWPRLLGERVQTDDGRILVGMGSILDVRLDELVGTKIVFGTGINSQARLPRLDSSYDIRFVRGPISAAALGGAHRWIADSAVAVRLLPWPEAPTRASVGFMPHFHTTRYLDWTAVCADLGLHYINPQWPPERVMGAIRGCERIITEAMHGAIVADAFRIPWLRVTINSWQKEDFDFSALKWLDWGLALGADVTPVHLEPLHQWGRRMLFNPVRLADRIRAQRKLVGELRALPRTGRFHLSDERRLRQAEAEIGREIARLKAEP